VSDTRVWQLAIPNAPQRKNRYPNHLVGERERREREDDVWPARGRGV